MLVADDDPAIVRMLAERCNGMGFKVETATNGIQALIKANRSHPDVMVIDVNMPEADGLTVCGRLLDSSRQALNVIVVTGSRDVETVERCEGFGAFYVRKGPGFWASFEASLAELFPQMATRINGPQKHPSNAEVWERSRVLVIDDDSSVKQFLATRLEKCGVDLIFASDIRQGYRMACRDAPSVIVSDYFLPDGGIPYLLSRLRTTPATMKLPVLVLTGLDLDPIAREGLMREVNGRPGAAQIFRKSFDTDEFFGALQKLCGFEHNRIDG